MGTLISVIETALPVFLALALGTLCRQRSFLSRDNVDALKKVGLNITLPAVLLNDFASAEYSASTLILPVLVFLLCCGALGLGFLLLRLFETYDPTVWEGIKAQTGIHKLTYKFEPEKSQLPGTYYQAVVHPCADLA